MANITDKLIAVQQSGFIVHPKKSVLKPSMRNQYLGVIIDSESMTVALTPERAESLKKCSTQLLCKNTITVREAAQTTGKIVASFAAVRYGPLYY